MEVPECQGSIEGQPNSHHERIKKRETQLADTEEHFGHNEGSHKKKKKKLGPNGDAYTSASASTEEDPGKMMITQKRRRH